MSSTTPLSAPALDSVKAAAADNAPAAPIMVTVHSQPMRQLNFALRGRDVTLFLPQDLYFLADEVVKTDFAASNATANADATVPSEMQVLAALMAKVDARCRAAGTTVATAANDTDANSPTSATTDASVSATVSASRAKIAAYLPLLKALVADFHRRYLATSNNVHVAVRDQVGFSTETSDDDASPAYVQVLAAYYAAVETLSRFLPMGEAADALAKLTKPATPALFRKPLQGQTPAAAPAVFAVFGGQGNTTAYLDELRECEAIYGTPIRTLVDAADAHLAKLLQSSKANVRGLFTNGLSVRNWLDQPARAPDADYLVAAPVSMPLIGLTQLAWYLATVTAAGSTFAEARNKWFVAASGHSQGIIPAVVLAASDSESAFLANTLQALTLLFHIGTQATLAFPPTSVPPRVTADSEENGEGTPSPMLAVSGNLPLKALRGHIDETNRHLPSDKQVQVALVNGPKNVVVAGPPQSLYGLNLRLRKVKTPAGKDESRVPHHQRGVKFSSRFLPISAPFHSTYLATAVDRVRDLVADEHLGVTFLAKDLAVPVFATSSGKDLRTVDAADLAVFLAEEICTRPVDWELATAFKPTTHFVDFGPGGASGVGGLIHRNKEGSGAQVILASVFGDVSGMLGRLALLDARRDMIQYAPHWAKEHRPRLVKVGDSVHLDTKFTRLIGRPPVMVAGMTPTTVSAQFVSATLNAGYHVELAGGGHFTEAMLRDKVKDIMTRVAPGNAITINMMFLNPRQWAFQYPLVQALRREGYPVEGVCVAAGVPSFEVAGEILTSLAACGIKHVAFKPGSADAIMQVVRIAEAHPNMPILLQWTGGRAGGHHSFEDMHAPMLEHYAAIRRCKNIVLVAGSGLGGVQDTLPYLTGDWALAYARPAMPFDAVLFGSRMLVAKEAQTSDAAKDLIVSCPGIDDEADWEKTYVKPTGGILTVRSELGEPIHKVATRGVKLWKELDETVFNLPKDKRTQVVKEKRDYIIQRLNADAHRPWFGKKADGSVADLPDMTYAEIVNRLLELTYLKKYGRWIDASYGSLVMDVLLRIEERFTPVERTTVIDPIALRDDPLATVAAFLAQFPAAQTQLLTSEDVYFFIDACKVPTRKPAPFIPVLDEALEQWYKKDSLWQSEFVEAVVDEDVQRVCILQGPVATKFANKANVPVKEILDEVRDGHIAAVLERYYENSVAKVPTREYLTVFPTAVESVVADAGRDLISVSASGARRVLEVGAVVPARDQWLAAIAAAAPAWLRALVQAQHIVQGRMLADNYLPRLLAPRKHLTCTVSPAGLEITLHGMPAPGLVIRGGEGRNVTVQLTHFFDDQQAHLELRFLYSPETPYALVHEDLEGRNDRVKQFYADLWDAKVVAEEVRSVTTSHTVDRESIARFCKVIQNDTELFVEKGQDKLAAPLDYAIVAGWKAVVQPLFSTLIDGDLLKLVHLSNGFKVLAPGALVYAGDTISTKAEVASITNTPTGKKISVRGVLSRDGVDLVEVTSAFFVRGTFDDYHTAFDNVAEEPIKLTLRRAQDLAVLESKDYIQFDKESPVPIAVGSTLIFRLQTHVEYQSSTMYASLATTGTIEQLYKEQVLTVGRVAFECTHPLAIQTSPVVAMLQRLGGVTVEQPTLFATGGYKVHATTFNAPATNTAYATVSGDYNPIHTAPLFADLAGLPDTITHGMWTSALTRRWVELYAAENQPQRVVSFAVDFVDMCVPNTELTTTLRHVGMQNGRKIIEVTTAEGSTGRVIVKGTAHVAQATSCFVFTGQGSQEVGMGMDLYKSSPVAREIWDRADRHFKSEYGFSILEIVRSNPKSKTVHFGGPRGRKIRANYRSMTYDAVDPESGKVTTKSLFPTIGEHTESYTFTAPQGLLYATQFTQPALTLVEKAAFADMEAHGLVPPDCPFAGHSLGEYAALAAVADVLPVESLVDIVFYRGMTMQHAVTRDAAGRSNYGMCAVNPARVHKFFKEKDLEELVAHIHLITGSLLEIVNYNVDGWQYVVAGDMPGLKALTLVINALAKGVFDQAKLEELVRTTDLVKMPLVRGHATIPLPGIDVPFHSSFLLPGVAPFREYLQRKIKPAYIRAQRLEGRYIPNLTAKPFKVTVEYIEMVAKQAGSPVLNAALKNLKLESPEDKEAAAHMLLIELLAYQFASAVRWIETQDVLFAEYKVERLIEVGPSSTLVGMAERTLKLKYTAYDDALTFRRANLSYQRNTQEIYYAFEEEAEAPAAAAAASTDAAAAAPAAAAQAAAPVAAAVPAAGGAAEEVPEAPIASSLLLGCIIAQKLKKPLNEVPFSKSIKDLVGGKSTMQNEILGDLQKEIGSIPERAEEVSLDELGAQIQVAGLGKHSSSLVAKLISSKMPGGFTLTQVKDHLKAAYGLGPQRADALLLLGCTMEPGNRLPNEEEAKKWLAQVAQTYAAQTGITYRTASGAGGASGGAAPAMSAAQLKALFASQQSLWTAQLNALASALEMDLHAPALAAQQHQANIEALQQQLDLWVGEHGDVYAQGIQPLFTPRKARHFDSAWNWVRQDAMSLFFDIIFGRLQAVDRALIAKAAHVMNRADATVIDFMEYWLNNHLPFFVDVPAENYDLVRRLGRELVDNCKAVVNANPVYKYVEVPTGPETIMTEQGKLEYREVQRDGVRKMASYVARMHKDHLLFVQEKNGCHWAESKDKTETLFQVMNEVAEEGLSLAQKQILITGCGRDSIGASILKGALSAGAQVVVTTSRFTQEVTEYYRSIYEQHGSRGSALVVVPFNQGSHTDTQQLIHYIYNELGWDLDFVIPFAAISENGREITDIDSKSELAHRLMLTNLLRMLGLVISEKKARDQTTRPAHVVLPLSPNHGTFGGDGLYGESKIALETLLNRWESESWSEYLCVIGAVIGWTRGTGLMSSNNLVSQGIEKLGVYTFSTVEMAFNLLCLMHPRITHLAQEEALSVDLAGAMNRLSDLKNQVSSLRTQLVGTAEVKQAVLRDQTVDRGAVQPVQQKTKVTPRANLTFKFPELPNYKELSEKLGHLQGMVDLDKVVVITGYGEVGPYGNARTRWEMESQGHFSLEGCIEMAWMMGFIRHHHGALQGRQYSGWVDVETGAPVKDSEIKAKYEARILKHTGIRLIEPQLFDGYNPEQKTMLQEIVLEEDLRPFEVSKEEAMHFAREHGAAKCVTQELPSGQWLVTLKKGATMFIPKALRFDRLVAGQIPTGWSAKRYGVPEDIVQQVDPITLYVLVSTVEALVNSGITDPYEFYKYVHVTEVGNTSGSGVGGMMANRKIYKDRFLDKPVQQDILQESFINTMAAWVNLLLLSSSGPIKTPVGACATAVESVEIGVETIQSGKAKVVVVGGFDDFQEEGSYEFANMKATSNADTEIEMGRAPKEMCRPTTSTRGGFMESQGSGIQILMSASVAIEMGAPIYGVVALSNTATDKQGRSVPAPGQGVLTTARQMSTQFESPKLSLAYRKKQIERRMRQVSEWMEDEVQDVLTEAAAIPEADREAFIRERRETLERDAQRQIKSIYSTWGNDFWCKDPTIAPLRGALAVWGLTVDDIGVASFHGTGTKANDFNESQVVHRQFEHLGRAKGNPVPSVFQKYLTGHPKGAAAAWMLNGALQVLETGIIPGNRNADNIDPKLQQFTHIMYPSVSIQTDGVKAALLKSFGFGQVGGELLVLHPHYVLATMPEHVYEAYKAQRDARHAKTYRYWHDTLTGSQDFVSVKNAAPYSADLEKQVYLNPMARAEWDAKQNTYTFSAKSAAGKGKAALAPEWLESLAAQGGKGKGVGVDIEVVSVFANRSLSEDTFIQRNFTPAEIAYCQARPDPAASLAGKWAAKEAVVKAISSFDLEHAKVWTQGAGAPLIDIEVLAGNSGAPEVHLHGEAQAAGAQVGVHDLKVTISHAGEYAVAVCNAL